MPPEQPPFGLALVDGPVAGIRDENSIFLIREPGVVTPVIGGLDLERLVTHQALLEILQRVLDSVLHTERGEVRPRVGDEAGFRVDGRSQRRDV